MFSHEVLELYYRYTHVLIEYPILAYLLVVLAVGLVPICMRLSVLSVDDKAWALIAVRQVLGKFPLVFIALSIGIFLMVTLFCYEYSNSKLDPAWNEKFWGGLLGLSSGLSASAVAGLFLGLFAVFCIGRWLEPWLLRVLDKSTRSSISDGFTDARRMENDLPDVINFDPVEALKHRPKGLDDGIFFGLFAQDKGRKSVDYSQSIWISRDLWKKYHVQVVGPTGAGKGVQCSMVLYQSIVAGDGVLAVDPKYDEWAPHVHKFACDRSDRPFTFINLRDGEPAQINPLKGCSRAEFEELLVAGFGFEEKDKPSDFYKIADRESASLVADYFYKLGRNDVTFAEISRKNHDILGDDLYQEAKAFVSLVREMARLESVNAIGDNVVDFKSIIDKGGSIYVVGSTREPKVIRAQKMVVLRMMQLVENRGFSDNRRHITCHFSEFKYLLSLVTIRLLGTVRDKSCNVILDHQVLGDFNDCGLDPKAVSGAVDGNCRLKWIYGTDDDDTIKWALKKSGEIQVETESVVAERNDQLSEIMKSEKRISSRQRALFEANHFLQMPDKCAMIVRPSVPARLAFSSPIKVAKGDLPRVESQSTLKQSKPGDSLK